MRAAVALASVCLLALSSIPVLIAYLTVPADRQFMGIVSDVPDWAQYLAWMRAFTHRIVIENPITCEPQSPAFFNLQWLVLGRLATWLPLPVVLEGFRLAAGALFLFLTWSAARAYFGADRRGAVTAWWLMNASAGWGVIWVFDKYLFGRTDARNPLDIYVLEPITFQNMIVFPHFLVAAALIFLIFRAAARAIDEERWAPAWTSAGFSLLLGVTHAYDLVIIYAVLGVFFVTLWAQRGWSWFRFNSLALIGLVSFPPPAYFAYLTSTDPVWRKVLGQFGDAGVFTPNPPHLLILVGLPLLLTLLTIRNVLAWRQADPWRLLVRVWCVVNFFLLYIPTDFQVHMLSGWQIPLGLLASEGLLTRIWPWLQERWPRAETVGVVLLLALTLPTNLYLLAWRVREVRRFDHHHYLYRDEIAALEWLDRHAREGECVLAALEVGQFVPGRSRTRPHAGHWAMTVDYRQRRQEIAAFFNVETSAADRIAILRRSNTRYIIAGRAERALGGFDPASASMLAPVFTAGETTLYQVTLPATFLPLKKGG